MSRRIVWWEFTPWGGLFFKGSRPWGAPGGSSAGGEFPPPGRTVAGAVRRAIAHHARVGSADAEMADRMLGALRLVGPYVMLDGELVVPVPASLSAGIAQVGQQFVRQLAWRSPLDEPSVTDHGTFRLPGSLSPKLLRVESLAGHWLRPSGFAALLSGRLPRLDEVLGLEDLVALEPRVGLMRNPITGIGDRHYHTTFLRLRQGVSILTGLAGKAIAESEVGGPVLPASGCVRLGGEGSMAWFRRVRLSAQRLPLAPLVLPRIPPRRFALYFLTPGMFSGVDPGAANGDWRRWHKVAPETARSMQGSDHLVWTCDPFSSQVRQSAVPGRPRFHVVSVCSDAPVSQGSYLQVNHSSKAAARAALMTLMAPGTVWYCELDGQLNDRDAAAALKALHGAHLGNGRELGRGQVAVIPGWMVTPALHQQQAAVPSGRRT